MSKELLAALGRIEAIAHYYSKVAGHSDEITDAFKSIVDETGEAIALAKEAAAPDLLAALEQCLPIIDAHRRTALGEGDIAAMNARAAIAKAKGN